MNFNAKNLTYGPVPSPPDVLFYLFLINRLDANEPSFLRKLKSEYGGGNSIRHERPIARPKRLKNEDEDDEPAYVDETTNDTISKVEFEAMQSGENRALLGSNKDEVLIKTSEDPEFSAEEVERITSTQKQQLAGIGAFTKRKAVKVVGQNDEEVEAKSKGNSNTKEKNAAKKAKKVKLSFDEEG